MVVWCGTVIGKRPHDGMVWYGYQKEPPENLGRARSAKRKACAEWGLHCMVWCGFVWYGVVGYDMV